MCTGPRAEPQITAGHPWGLPGCPRGWGRRRAGEGWPVRAGGGCRGLGCVGTTCRSAEPRAVSATGRLGAGAEGSSLPWRAFRSPAPAPSVWPRCGSTPGRAAPDTDTKGSGTRPRGWGRGLLGSPRSLCGQVSRQADESSAHLFGRCDMGKAWAKSSGGYRTSAPQSLHPKHSTRQHGCRRGSLPRALGSDSLGGFSPAAQK